MLALVLANVGFYAWSSGLLGAYGFAPASQTEPQRLAQQLKPDALRVLTPRQARQLESNGSLTTPLATAFATPSATPSATAVECLQAGIFNEEQTVVLRNRLISALPAGSWVLEDALEPARWIVYMGQYSSADAVAKKKSELRGLNVSFGVLSNAALEPGLSLGNFKSRPEAEAALARIARQGVKTAKVMLDQPEQRGQRLTLATVNAALRNQLEAIKPQLAGKALQICG